MNRTKTAASTTEGAKKPPTADQQTSGEITAVKLPKPWLFLKGHIGDGNDKSASSQLGRKQQGNQGCLPLSPNHVQKWNSPKSGRPSYF